MKGRTAIQGGHQLQERKRLPDWGNRFWVHRYGVEMVGWDEAKLRADVPYPEKRERQAEQRGDALGRSRGGFSTQIHVLVETLGTPVECSLTAGQVADVTQAEGLLAGWHAQYGLMDKAYGANHALKQLELPGIIPAILPKSKRKRPRDDDRHIDKERHLVECFIGKLKQFCRGLSRFDKRAANFMHFIRVAALIWLR